MYRYKKPAFFTVAREKLSFTVAAFTVAAFVMGNMVGQHGWYAFWKTVLGNADDTLIVFDGMVTPVEYIPDYRRWAEYGGSTDDHTFAEVPRDLLVALPAYRASELKNVDDIPFESRTLAQLTYSMGNLSSYESGDDHSGSHTGVDIRVPVGTPIRSIGNGVIEKVIQQNYGFGYYIVVRYPNVPDATASDGTSTFYATYAHLSVILVREGQVVRKGEVIARSGETGLASGPHLHFQIDTEDAPYHPYWPFTAQEASANHMTYMQAVNAGLNQSQAALYTASPIILVQSFATYSAPQIATNGNAALNGVVSQTISSSTARTLTLAEKLQNRAAIRAASRQSAADARTARIAARQAAAAARERFGATTAVTQNIVVQNTEEPVAEISGVIQETVSSSAPSESQVYRVELTHSGVIERGWQPLTIRAVDRDGRLVKNASFDGKLYVRADFGTAEIRPDVLTASDFTNGVATVSVFVRDKKTVYFVTRGAFETQSAPMVVGE